MEQQIIPMLSYEKGVEAIQWLCRVFGFTEKEKWLDDEGRLSHGEIMMNNFIVMLATPTTDFKSSMQLRSAHPEIAEMYKVPYVINGVLVYVDDIQKHFDHAKMEGAVILSDIEYGGPGTRYRAEDLEGQRWMFMQKQQTSSHT